MSDTLQITPEEALSLRAARAYEAMEEGAIVEIDPELADFMGATEDDALSFEDAQESRFDHLTEVGHDDE